jgi:hypothetical protein
MQQNTNANYEAYQHLPNKSYYNVRATPHATQGGLTPIKRINRRQGRFRWNPNRKLIFKYL